MTSGDLNGDGRGDWAGVVLRQKSEFLQTNQLYVLLQLPQGGYRIAKKSREQEITGLGCCWIEGLNIHRSSLYVQSNAETGSVMEAGTHQFKFNKRGWQLTGIRIYRYDPNTDASRDTGMNLLTRSVVEKRQKGENKPAVKKRYQKFGSHLLKDFDFNTGFGFQQI